MTAPAPTRRHTGAIVAAAVGGIGLLGGGFALVNSLTDDSSPGADGHAAAVAPDPNPEAGPGIDAPLTPVTLPGPQVSTTTTTTAPTPEPQVPAGDAIGVAGAISVIPADGWELAADNGGDRDGMVWLRRDGADFRVAVFAVDPDADATTVLNQWVDEVLSDEVQNIEILRSGPAQVPASSVVSSALFDFEGLWATNQGGVPVEGVAFVDVHQDGFAVVADTLNALGEWDQFRDDYFEMLNSLVASY